MVGLAMTRTKKRVYEYRQNLKGHPVSPHAKNWVFCPKCGHNKFLYATIKQAKMAVKFSGAERFYYCKTCMGYHLTSETKEIYYAKKTNTSLKRYGDIPLKSKDWRNHE